VESICDEKPNKALRGCKRKNLLHIGGEKEEKIHDF